jgi:hypothetical protein
MWFFFISVNKPADCVDLPIPGPPKKLMIMLSILINIHKNQDK